MSARVALRRAYRTKMAPCHTSALRESRRYLTLPLQGYPI